MTQNWIALKMVVAALILATALVILLVRAPVLGKPFREFVGILFLACSKVGPFFTVRNDEVRASATNRETIFVGWLISFVLALFGLSFIVHYWINPSVTQ